MIKCVADIIEAARGWQAELYPFKGMYISTDVYSTKEKLKEIVEKQARKLGIEITCWNE